MSKTQGISFHEAELTCALALIEYNKAQGLEPANLSALIRGGLRNSLKAALPTLRKAKIKIPSTIAKH